MKRCTRLVKKLLQRNQILESRFRTAMFRLKAGKLEFRGRLFEPWVRWYGPEWVRRAVIRYTVQDYILLQRNLSFERVIDCLRTYGYGFEIREQVKRMLHRLFDGKISDLKFKIFHRKIELLIDNQSARTEIYNYITQAQDQIKDRLK